MAVPRRIATFAFLLPLALLLACASAPDGSTGSADGGSSAPDAGSDDAGVVFSDAPFGVHLTGEFTLRRSSGGEELPATRFSCDLYFPGGRRPGARAVLAAPTKYPVGLAQASGVLDASGALAGLAISGHDGQEFRLEVTITRDGAFVGNLWRNVAYSGNDAVEGASGTAAMTPSGPIPEPTLTPMRPRFGPISSIQLIPTVPIDDSAAPALAFEDGQPFDGVRKVIGGNLVVAPAQSFPPTVKLSFDLTNVRDVLGRPMALTVVPTPLTTTADVVDGTLSEPLPDGAVVLDGDRWTQADGVLTVGRAEPYGIYGPYTALLSLGDRHGAAKLRIRHRQGCTYGDRVTAQVWLVTSFGVKSNLTPTACSAEFVESVIDLPGPGLLWLVVAQADLHGKPQWSPSPPASPYVLDAVTFE